MKEVFLVSSLVIAAGTTGAAATTGTATSGTGFPAAGPLSNTGLLAIPQFDTSLPAIPPSQTAAMPPFVNSQPPDLLACMDYLATTSGSMARYGVTDASTTGFPYGVNDQYTSIPFQTIPANLLQQMDFDSGRTAGPSTVMAQGSAPVRSHKRPHDMVREGDKGGIRKRRKGPINNQLAPTPSGSGVPATNQETTTQATFTAIPWPEGMPDAEYGRLLTAQIMHQYGGPRMSA